MTIKTQRQRSAKIKRLDKRLSKIVSDKSGGRCELCGRAGTDPHHARKKGTLALRYCFEGCLWLCRECHQSLERHPKKNERVFINLRGVDIWDSLGILRQETGLTLEEVETILKKEESV